MFLAHLDTATGPMTIALIDIAQEDMDGPFNALISTLSQVSDPIEFTSTNTFMREVPSGTPATLTFKYLGTGSAEFADQDAFGASMNEHLARGVFQCAVEFEADDTGRITAEFEYFELVGDETPRMRAPLVHKDAMKEIRVCWIPDVEHEPHGVFRDGGFWYGDYDEPRRALALIVKAENAKHGAGTHWIEERNVGADSPASASHGTAPGLDPRTES